MTLVGSVVVRNLDVHFMLSYIKFDKIRPHRRIAVVNEDKSRHPIFCAKCDDEITSRSDLITVWESPFVISAYHARCYVKRAQGLNPLGTPINSASSIWSIPLISLTSLTFFFVSHFQFIFIILSLILPSIRLISWIAIERRIPNNEQL